MRRYGACRNGRSPWDTFRVMSEPRYPSAREVAPKIRAHFERFLPTATAASHPAMLAAPAVADVEAVVDAAFWASLRREENYLPRISLALLPPSGAAFTTWLLAMMPLPPGL